MSVVSTSRTDKLTVGAHVSLGRSPAQAARVAAETGLTSMQIFASSPGAWKPPIIDRAAAGAFRAARAEHGIETLFIHAIYLINLASADPDLARRSRQSLISTLHAGSELGARAVITHIGSHGGRGFEAVADQVSAGLRQVLAETPDDIDLVLENSAGAGGILGASIDELATLLVGAGNPARLKIGLDTAHLCGAGWDFQLEGTAARLTAEVEQQVGLERLAVIHANDSARPVASRRDRHANLGEGFIGVEGFRRLLAEVPLRQVPWILETPQLERRCDDVLCLREALSAGS